MSIECLIPGILLAGLMALCYREARQEGMYEQPRSFSGIAPPSAAGFMSMTAVPGVSILYWIVGGGAWGIAAFVGLAAAVWWPRVVATRK